jgi:hypothetical protein
MDMKQVWKIGFLAIVVSTAAMVAMPSKASADALSDCQAMCGCSYTSIPYWMGGNQCIRPYLNRTVWLNVKRIADLRRRSFMDRPLISLGSCQTDPAIRTTWRCSGTTTVVAEHQGVTTTSQHNPAAANA